MLIAKFLNGRTSNVKFRNVKENVVELIGDNVDNVSGFGIYNSKDILLGNYSNYKTKYNIYTEIEGGIQLSTGETEEEVVPVKKIYTVRFSCDQSQGTLDGQTVYEVVEGASRSSIEIPNTIPNENYQFVAWSPSLKTTDTITSNENYTAIFEYIVPLEEVKEIKVNEMNEIQQTTIQNGVDVVLTDGTSRHFTLTDHDQQSLTALQIQIANGSQKIPWHTSDASVPCEYFTPEDMTIIVNTATIFVAWHVTYFRDLRIYINALESKEEVNAIEYGVDIPLEYQSEPLQDMIALQGVQ